MKEVNVSKNEAGQRFDKLLLKYLNLATISFIYKMLRKKNIVLNGKKASGNEILKEGDRIEIYLSDETYEKFSRAIDIEVDQTKKVKLSVVYENEDLIFLNKPAGMLSQKAEKKDVSLVEHLTDHLLEQGIITKESLQGFRPGICNRLDRNTTGLVVGGKTLLGLQEMTRLIREKKINKYYLTVVKGVMEESVFAQGYLIKDTVQNKVVIQSKPTQNSEEIKTGYEPLCHNEEYTLVKVWLITGKSHQIRAHLNSLGFYIVGDTKYGQKEINQHFMKKYGLKHQLLHAYQMQFVTKDEIIKDRECVTAKVPTTFGKILKGEFNIDNVSTLDLKNNERKGS